MTIYDIRSAACSEHAKPAYSSDDAQGLRGPGCAGKSLDDCLHCEQAGHCSELRTRVGERVHNELLLAKKVLESLPPAVSIYGGARVPTTDPFYRETVELARALSERGITVVSGGGPGIMQAANKGAREGGLGVSVGLNIVLPFEQVPNPWQDISLNFDHFSARKISFCKYSCGFVVMPGGVGTLDELFEVLTLIQTGKMPEIPVLLYGSDFWAGLVGWLRGTVLARGLVSEVDLNERIVVVDSVSQAMSILEPAVRREAERRASAAAKA